MKSAAFFLAAVAIASWVGCASDPAASPTPVPTAPTQSSEPDAYTLSLDPGAGEEVTETGALYLYYARCKKLHGNTWEWTSARTPDRSLAQQWAQEHGDQYPGHRASVRRQRNR